MVDEKTIEDKFEGDDYKLEEWCAFAQDMLHRMRTYGGEMRFGDTENCLTYREIKSYGMGQLENERKDVYDAHRQECKVCDDLVRASQHFFREIQPLSPPPSPPSKVYKFFRRLKDNITQK